MRPGSHPRPATAGASSLPSNSHCMPRQMPRNGDAGSSRRRIADRQLVVSDAVAAKWPTPGRTMAAARSRSAGAAGSSTSAPHARKRLAHRGEVAGAVVDERDHSSSFVLGSTRARRRSRAHATRSARANALNDASIRWWLDRPYSTFTWTFARAPSAKPSKKSVTSSDLQVADHARPDAGVDDGVRPAAEVDGRHRQRLVHRHHEIARAVDAAARAERCRHRFAERQARVLHGVVLVDVEVAVGRQAEIEPAVPRHQLQHVIEEADARPHVVAPASLERSAAPRSAFPACPASSSPCA